MQVKEIMKQPYVVDKNIELSEAAKIMSTKNIGCLIIMNKSKIAGIVTERDIIKNFGKSETVTDVMTREVVTTEPDEEIASAAELMTENKIKKLPVMKNGSLVGIITATDIIANVEDAGESFFFN